MKFFNKNNDVDYTRPFDEYIRNEEEYIKDESKSNIKINSKLIKRIITSIVLVPTTLAVSNVQKVNEKESEYNIDNSIIEDDLSIENNYPILDDVFLAPDGSYWVSQEDYELVMKEKYYLADDNSYWVSEEDYLLVNGNQKKLS